MRGNGTTVLSSRREWPLRSTNLDAGLYHRRKVRWPASLSRNGMLEGRWHGLEKARCTGEIKIISYFAGGMNSHDSNARLLRFSRSGGTAHRARHAFPSSHSVCIRCKQVLGIHNYLGSDRSSSDWGNRKSDVHAAKKMVAVDFNRMNLGKDHGEGKGHYEH